MARVIFWAGLSAPLWAVVWAYCPLSGAEWRQSLSILDRIALHRLANSVALGFLTAIFSTLLAIPVFGVYLFLPGWGRKLLVPAGLLPLSLPPFGVTSAWMTFLSQWNSNEGRILWSAESASSRFLYSLPGTACILSFCFWPIAFLFLTLSSRLTRSQVESAFLYLNPWSRFRRVFFPAWKEPLAIAATMIFCLGLTQFEVPSLLQVNVYPLEIFIRFSALLREQEALMLCLPYALFLSVLAWWVNRGANTLAWSEQDEFVIRFTPWIRRISGAAAVGVFAVSIVVPLVEQVRRSGSPAFIWNIGMEQAGPIFHSIAYCGTGALGAVILGLLFTAGREINGGLFSSAFFLFLFILPGGLLASGWLWLRSSWPGVLPDFIAILTLISAYISHVFILGYLAGKLLWKQYGFAQREMDSLLPLTVKDKFLHLYLPTFWLPVSQAAALISLFLWGEIAITTLLYPPGAETLAVQYFNLLHYGSEKRTAAVGLFLLWIPTLILLLTFLPGLVRARMSRRESSVSGTA